MISEIMFLVEEADEGGYTARALDHSIYTDAETMEELKANIKDAVMCHFGDEEVPKMLQLHIVRDEVMAL